MVVICCAKYVLRRICSEKAGSFKRQLCNIHAYLNTDSTWKSWSPSEKKKYSGKSKGQMVGMIKITSSSSMEQLCQLLTEHPYKAFRTLTTT